MPVELLGIHGSVVDKFEKLLQSHRSLGFVIFDLIFISVSFLNCLANNVLELELEIQSKSAIKKGPTVWLKVDEKKKIRKKIQKEEKNNLHKRLPCLWYCQPSLSDQICLAKPKRFVSVDLGR